MLRFKQTFFAFILIVVSLAGIYMVGCDSTSVDSNKSNITNTDEVENFEKLENSLSKTILIPTINDITPSHTLKMHLNQFDVELISSKMNKSDKSFTFGLKTFSTSTGTKFLNLKIQAYKENNFIGYTNTLSDNNNNLLWEYGLSIDTMQENHVRLIENTQDDYLILDRYVNENAIIEKYETNGNSKEFTFYTKDTERIAELNKLVFQSLNSKTKNVVSLSSVVSSSDQMTINTLEKFHEFYKTDNSLHDNIYGQLSVELTGNEDFQAWFQDEYVPNDTDPQISWWFDDLCRALNICAAIKCGFLGPGNPVCSGCAIGSISCEVARFLEPDIF